MHEEPQIEIPDPSQPDRGRFNFALILAATAVLTILARTPDDGGAPEVEAPLTLKGGKLSFGHTPLVKVPNLAWPQ